MEQNNNTNRTGRSNSTNTVPPVGGGGQDGEHEGSLHSSITSVNRNISENHNWMAVPSQVNVIHNQEEQRQARRRERDRHTNNNDNNNNNERSSARSKSKNKTSKNKTTTEARLNVYSNRKWSKTSTVKIQQSRIKKELLLASMRSQWPSCERKS